MLLNIPPDPADLASWEPAIPREEDGIDPELATETLALHVDVRSLAAIEAVEVQPVGPRQPLHLRHVCAPRSARTTGRIGGDP